MLQVVGWIQGSGAAASTIEHSLTGRNRRTRNSSAYLILQARQSDGFRERWQQRQPLSIRLPLGKGMPLGWCLEDPAAPSAAHFGNKAYALLSAHSSCKANLREDALVVSHHPSLPVVFATRLFGEFYILRSTSSSQEAGKTAILEVLESRRRNRRKGVDEHFDGHQARHIMRRKHVRDSASGECWCYEVCGWDLNTRR